MPPAPERLSTTTDLPRIFSSAAATGRAARSACPPGGNATIMVMLRLGQACAHTGRPKAAASGVTTAPCRNARRSMCHSALMLRGFITSLNARSRPWRRFICAKSERAPQRLTSIRPRTRRHCARLAHDRQPTPYHDVRPGQDAPATVAGSMNLRFRHFGPTLQKVEIAALIGLADVVGEHRAIAARVFRRRLRPGRLAAGHLLFTDVQMDAASVDVDFDLVAGL